MMKKFLRTFLSVLLVLTMVISVTACGDKPDPEGPEGPETGVAELNVSAALGLDLFETKTLEATDKNGAKVNATWQIADSSIATITSDGAVSAKAVGQTKVTASYNGHTAECTVTVRDSGERPNLWLSSTSKTTVVGGKVAAYPAVTYKGGELAAQLTVTGGNSAVATYEVKDGAVVFTGVAVGSTTVEISGICGNYVLSSIEVEVNVVDSTTLLYSDGDLTLCTIDYNGMKPYHPVNLVVYDNEGQLVSNPTITWSSSDEQIAKYNATTGKVESQGKAGKATLRATYGSVYVEFEVNVLRASMTKATGLSVTDNYKKVDLSFLEGIAAPAEISEIYDETNGKAINFTLNGNEATLTDYTGTKGYMNWAFRGEKVEIKTEVLHATHRVSTPDEYYALGDEWEAATAGNVDGTILYVSGTSEWIVALGGDIDFEGVNVSTKTIFGKQYAQDGDTAAEGYKPATWCGVFDGRGFAIKNAKWDNGMLSSFHQQGVIRNLALIGCVEEWGGGILGNYGRGTVENCYINATISGKSSAHGGLYFYSNGKNLLRVKGCILNISIPQGSTNIHLLTSQAGAANEPTITDVFAISAGITKTWSGDTTNGAGIIYKTAAAWAGEVSALPVSFNSYWNLGANSLSFGDEVVLTW